MIATKKRFSRKNPVRSEDCRELLFFKIPSEASEIPRSVCWVDKKKVKSVMIFSMYVCWRSFTQKWQVPLQCSRLKLSIPQSSTTSLHVRFWVRWGKVTADRFQSLWLWQFPVENFNNSENGESLQEYYRTLQCVVSEFTGCPFPNAFCLLRPKKEERKNEHVLHTPNWAKIFHCRALWSNGCKEAFVMPD